MSGPPIRSREELVAYLFEAQRVENAILTQYLFAAMSIRRDWETLTSAQAEFLRESRRLLYEIAREEMFHLGVVCNALLGMGLGTRLSASTFRKSSMRWFNRVFELAPFTIETLDRLIEFEAPLRQTTDKTLLGLVIAPPSYGRVGELYEKIEAAYLDPQVAGNFACEVEKYFLGKKLSGATDLNYLYFFPPTSATQMSQLFANIRKNGEGPSEPNLLSSHQFRLIRLRNTWEREFADDDSWVSYPVAKNPHSDLEGTLAYLKFKPGFLGTIVEKTGIAHWIRGAPHPSRINGNSANVATLFDHIYQTLMLMLDQYFSPLQESSETRDELFMLCRSSMVAIMHPLGELLTELPLGSNSKRHAGPPFVLQPDVTLPFIQSARWRQLIERIDREKKEAFDLGTPPNFSATICGRLRGISDSLEILRTRVASLKQARDREVESKQENTDSHAPNHTRVAQATPPSNLLVLEFSGFFLCRLATDPDQFDEPWGMSNGPRVYPPFEPRLDRIIRTNIEDDKLLRLACPQKIGIKVIRATLGGLDTTANFAGFRITFEGKPVFDGRNQLKASSGREHIVPLIVALRDSQNKIVGQAGIRDYVDQEGQQLIQQSAVAMALLTEAEQILAQELTTVVRVNYLNTAMTMPNCPEHQQQLFKHRISRLTNGVTPPENENLARVSSASNFFYSLDRLIEPPPKLNGLAASAEPWRLEFQMGAFDFDAMCGFIKGKISVKYQ